MSKNVEYIQHVKSRVVVDGKPKLPTPSQLVEGEIAINYADGYETMSIKSSSGNIVSFSSDNVRDKNLVGKKDAQSPNKSGEIFNSYTDSTANTARGKFAHAEGFNSHALGDYSHSEGSESLASGINSHAEGTYTIASGSMGHAEGNGTIAAGAYGSHAEGYSTIASGQSSHAEGYGTQTYNQAEHAEGKYNKSHSGSTDENNTIHSIGIGTISDRKNAVEIMTNGDFYVTGIGNYDGINYSTASTLQNVIQNKANTNHKHLASDITGGTLDNARLNNIPVSKLSGVTVSATEINRLSGVTSNIQTQLNNKAASNHSHNAATTGTSGFMSAADKIKLDGIEKNANNYTLPQADNDTLGGVKLGYSTSGKNYAVSADTDGKAFVNVPWSDTKATLSGLGITATAEELNHMDGVSGNVQTQLNTKAASNHTHSISQVTNLQNTLDSKASKSTTLSGYGITDGVNAVSVTGNGNAVTSASISGHSLTLTKGTSFAAASHTHTISQISDVTVSADEVNRLSGVTSNVQTQLNNKAASSHSHNAATTGASGFMSAADKIKLDGIAANANKYTLPQADSDTLGGVKLGYTTTGKNYAVSADTNGNAFVNVPWTDTKTTLSDLGITATATELNYMDGVTSNVQTQLNGKASKSTTLSGYGITDGVNAVSVTGGGNAITSASISGHSLTLTKGTSFATATHNHDASNINSGTLSADRLPKIPTSKLEGIISSENLPSYVDDVLEFSASTAFPQTGESGKIYVDTATNLTYRWGGSSYVEISKSLALGTTSSTAFRGDYGNTAYQHAIKKGSQFSSGLYKIATNSEGHVTAATAVQKSDITALGIPGTDTKYTLPQADSDTLGGVKLGYTTSGKNYAVSADTEGNIFVNVPWTDTKTTLSGLGITATAAELNYMDGVSGNVQTQLNTKAASNHTHSISQVTNLQNTLDSKASKSTTLSGYGITDGVNAVSVTGNGNAITSASISGHSLTLTKGTSFAAAGHTHSADNITGGTFNAARIPDLPLSKISDVTVSADEVNRLSGVTSNVQAQLNSKAASNHSHNAATTGASGFMSAADKIKLDGIAANANKYTLPQADSDTLGGVKLGYTTSGKTYAVSADTNGNAFVNVPWTNTTYNVATSGSNGLMSSTDKSKLDGIEKNANNYTLPQANTNTLGGVKLGSDTTQTVAANNVSSASSRTYAIQKDGNGKIVVNVPWTNTTYNVATSGSSGLMSATDKAKLDGIASGANKYTLPQANTNTLGGVKLGSDTTQTVAANGVTSASSRTYAIQKDGNGRMVVNVPWTDTNTTYTLSSFGISVSSDEINRLDGVTSNVQDQLNSKASKSTTLNGYGITDGVNAVSVSGSGNAITSASINGHSLTLTKGTSFAAASHTHTISQISDLNSGWDSLLKAAPSSYVTRWPSIGEVTGKQNLTIQLNGSAGIAYNGTSAQSVNITANAIGAASSSHNHDAGSITTGTLSSARLPKADKTNLGAIKLGYTTSGKTYAVSADTNGNAFVNVPWTNTTYNVATSGSSGLMSATDKAKLDSIASGATKYVLPQANSNTLGGVKLGSDTTQTVAANSVSSASSRTYAIQKDGNGRMVVNVPWSDTNTTYSFKTLNGQKLTGDTSNITISGLTSIQQKILNDIYDPVFHGLICGISTYGSNANNVKLSLSWQNYKKDTCELSKLSVTLPNASSSQAGVMTATDKSRLDSLKNNLADIDILQGFGGESIWDNSQQHVCVSTSGEPLVMKLTNSGGESRYVSMPGNSMNLIVKSSDNSLYNIVGFTPSYCKVDTTEFDPQIIGTLTLSGATTTKSGLMSKEDKKKYDSLYTAHNGKTYLQTNGGTMSGQLTCAGGFKVSNGTCELYGEGIEMYHATPFIDFHYGKSTGDYSSRIIESSSGVLSINNVKINNKGQVAISGATFDQAFSVLGSIVVGDYVNATSTSNTAIYAAGGIYHNATNVCNYQISANGNAVFAGIVTAKQHATSSDERLKDDISLITSDVDKVSKVDFKEFTYKADEKKTKAYGVIAQELESVGLDNLVIEDEKGMKSVDYTSLLCLEIQHLRNEIAELKKMINKE